MIIKRMVSSIFGSIENYIDDVAKTKELDSIVLNKKRKLSVEEIKFLSLRTTWSLESLNAYNTLFDQYGSIEIDNLQQDKSISGLRIKNAKGETLINIEDEPETFVGKSL